MMEMEEKLATIPADMAHELRHQIYAWIISNGFAKDTEEAKLVAKHNGFLMNKTKYVEVKPDDYQEVKENAAKWEQLKSLLLE